MPNKRFVLQVDVEAFSDSYEALSIEASKHTTTQEIIECIAEKLSLAEPHRYELAEVIANEGKDCKERRIGPSECPVALQLLWPLNPQLNNNSDNNRIHDGQSKELAVPFVGPEYRFCLRRKFGQCMNWSFSWTDTNDSQLLKDYFLRFLYQPRDREYPDLCQLPDLTEQTLLENLKARFEKSHIYTYVGSILIAVNPFKFYPIYNPKYVQLYQNRRLGELPPHIFAIADAAYQALLRKRCNQCIVISGESGSGKTESTNLLLHHLTALSQKGSHGSGVERTILGAGPVLEAFGNAKTKHNNNSSRFGKFIQVNYKENGMVHGAVVQKYLLEKSRIVSQAKNERNYHVFYYLLAGADQTIKETLQLTKASDYFYLNQSKCYTLEGVDEAYEFSRLKQSLEMVGFSSSKQNRLYAVLSAVLHIGNVEFVKKSTYHADETVMVSNVAAVSTISKLLMVKEETLLSALTCKRTKAAKGETIIINYKLADAVATRDAMAKCLYGALFDWIVMQVNQALLTKQDTRFHKGNYIGVLDIFGFEDFGDQNYFEQFCINFANEHLHHYFNQHVFKYEQEEYKREGIKWKSIEFHDNQNCLNLIEGRPQGLLCQLDDQCNFPGASNSTVLQKFVNHQKNNPLFEVPPCRQSAFVIKHYAGKVKYQIKDFREKNLDLMRPDIVSLLKSSYSVFVRELVGSDPLSIFRWQILKAFFKAYFVFSKLREQSKQKRGGIIKTTPIVSSIKSNKLGNFEMKQRKNKYRPSSFKGTNRIEKSIKSLKTLKMIVGKTNNHLALGRTSRKHAWTVTAQFQSSLNQLMETLNQANPFFVRCIKSNADKAPHCFDDMLVLVQLRYTGMLETVTIRQAGYSVRLSFDEFIQHYRILLPKGLLSSQSDVKHFLDRMNLNRENYQIGCSKIFMRESEKSALDDMLHQEILKRIITLQKWVRTWITRRRFIQMRQAAVVIQTYARRWLAQQRLSHLKWIARYEHWAATTIQKNYRCFKDKKAYLRLKQSTIMFQSHVRGFLSRKYFKNELLARSKASNASINLDSQSSHSDEAFLSKGSSQEELESSRLVSKTPSQSATVRQGSSSKDSEESSGVHEDSEAESLPFEHTHDISRQSSPPPLPPRRQPPSSFIVASSLPSKPAESFERYERFERPPRQELFDVTRVSKLERKDTSETIEKAEMINKGDNNEKTENLEMSNQIVVDTEKPVKPLKPLNLYDDLDDKPRLDRRRNRPLRKLSLKRSKSNKPSAQPSLDSDKVTKSTSEVDITVTKQPIKLMVSEPSLPSSQPRPLPESLIMPECPPSQSANQKGAFQKAKKHFRTFITGSSNKVDKKYKTDVGQGEMDQHHHHHQQQQHHHHYPYFHPFHQQQYHPQSEEEGHNLLNSSHPKSKKSKPTPLYSSLLPTTFNSTNYTLLTRHNLKSALSFQKSDICALCESSMCQKTNALTSGFKCNECQLLFHTTCLSNANQVPCIDKTKLSHYSSPNLPTNPSRPPRNKYRNKNAKNVTSNNNLNINLSSSKTQSGPLSSSSHSGVVSSSSTSTTTTTTTATSSWNVTRTTEFIDPKDILITDVTELHYMEIFINNKIRQMEESKKTSAKESMVDVVFKIALKEFKSNLLSTYSVASQDGRLHLTYKNLIDHFGQVILNVCQQENTYKSFPVIMGVNAFRGFLDEFRNLGNKVQLDEKSKSKGGRRKRKKKESREEFIYKCDHKFASMMANIPTVCEVCSTLMWLTEKIWVCQRCKFTCHKKCTSKITVSCRDKVLLQNSKRLFGAPIENLISEEMRVPPLLDNLITAIELKGLYTEGIYRKSGASSKITELKNKLEENVDNVDLDSYSVHVLSAVLKSFLREMPNPLMTYELYDDFLWTTAISDPSERVQAIYSHITKLPKVHFDVLERLIFHLSRVAKQESANRMNANSLAIVFAPCILRTDKVMQMQDKLCDISKQTICIETLINDRLRQVKDTLANIEILDSVHHTTSSRLSSLKMSKSNLTHDDVPQANQTCQPDEEEELTQQIDLLEQEKAHLTIILPSFRLDSAGSDEDLLASNDVECPMYTDDQSLYSSSKADQMSRGASIELPAIPFRSQNLRHLTKRRVSQSPQNRRLPSRFSKPQANSPLSTQNGRSSLRSRREINKEPKRDLTLFRNDDNSYRV